MVVAAGREQPAGDMRTSQYLISGHQRISTLPAGSRLTVKSNLASIDWASITWCIRLAREMPPSISQPLGTDRLNALSLGSVRR
jgi:hypothetical protein